MTIPKFPKLPKTVYGDKKSKPPLPDPLKPELPLLMKLGSIIVHTDEMLSSGGHPVDMQVLCPLLNDPEVKQWIKAMGVYLPLKR